jgi:serine/threonine protein kinase
MCNKEKKCRAWISLDSLGLFVQGCLKDIAWFNSLVIPCNHSIFNQSVFIDIPENKLICIKNVAHGKFGYIDLASFETKSKHLNVYVKRPILSGKSLLYEACIQKLVKENLTYIGFPTGAPDVLKLFRLRDNSVCFAMEEIDGATTLDKFIDSIPHSQISSVIVDCLLQLSAMVWYLDTTLGINHRDLKPSNFLITEHEPKLRILQIEDEIIEIESKYSLTFIDFGFSCLGSTDTHISDISLSTVYSRADPCPKEGRDMYLFLAFLYIDFYSKLPSKLLSLFEVWLNIPGSNIMSFMRKDKETTKKWIYFIAGNENIKKFNSSPSKIVKDLQALI